MKSTKVVGIAASTLMLAGLVSGCGSTSSSGGSTTGGSSGNATSNNAAASNQSTSTAPKPTHLTIATQDFSEPVIDDYMVKDLIEQAYPSITIDIKQTSGGSGLMHQMMLKNDIQIYTGWDGTEFAGPLKQAYTGDYAGHPDKVYNYVVSQEMKQYNIWVSPSLGYQDTYALAVQQSTAQKYNLKTDSDVIKYAPNWTLAVDTTFGSRKGDGLADFEKLYNMNFKSVKSMNYDLMYPTLGKGSVDAAMLYSTDGRLKKLNLVTLKDDKNFFPPYKAVVLIKNDVYKSLDLAKVLKPLWGAVSVTDQTELNYEVDVQKKDDATVAHDFLVKKGLLKN